MPKKGGKKGGNFKMIYMAKVRIIINKSKADRQGLCPLKIRVTENYARKEVYLPGVKVNPKFWDHDKQKVSNDPMLNVRIQKAILDLNLEINKQIALDQEVQPASIIQKLKTNGSPTKRASLNIPDYLDTHFCDDSNLAYSTRKSYKSLSKIIKVYDPRITLNKINLEWIAKFKEYLITGRGLNNYSLSTRLKLIKRVCMHAFQNKLILKNPLDGLRIKQGIAHRNYLTIEQIKQLELYKPDSTLLPTQKAFLFACYCGLRFSDLSTITYKNIIVKQKGDDFEYFLQYTMRKTKKNLNIALSKNALKLIDINEEDKDKPIFSLLTKQELSQSTDEISKKIESANALANKRLKLICKAAGLTDSYSFHCSRRTWFCTALLLGVDLVSLKELGGHSDLKVTSQYLRVLDSKKTEAMLKFDEI